MVKVNSKSRGKISNEMCFSLKKTKQKGMLVFNSIVGVIAVFMTYWCIQNSSQVCAFYVFNLNIYIEYHPQYH